MSLDAFGNAAQAKQRFPNAGIVSKDYFTPIDRWVTVHDSDNDGQKALLGILKPHPDHPDIERDALAQILELTAEAGGTFSFHGEGYKIGAITGDPGLRRPFVIQNADLPSLLKKLSETLWQNNPYSYKNESTMVDPHVTLERLLAPLKKTPAITQDHDGLSL